MKTGNVYSRIFRKVPEGYIGYVKELPGANSQGATLDEVKLNLEEAIILFLEANREFLKKKPAKASIPKVKK